MAKKLQSEEQFYVHHLLFNCQIQIAHTKQFLNPKICKYYY